MVGKGPDMISEIFDNLEGLSIYGDFSVMVNISAFRCKIYFLASMQCDQDGMLVPNKLIIALNGTVIWSEFLELAAD